jgi:flagellar hook assembly protein FlgD
VPTNLSVRSAAFARDLNYPNAFNPQTTIKYQLPTEQDVKLVIYNLLGQIIATLVNRKESAGYYTVIWNGQEDQGQPAANGVYFYRLTAGKFEEMRKMVLMR